MNPFTFQTLAVLATFAALPMASFSADEVKSLDVPAKFLLWDKNTRRIYASVPGSAPNAGPRANSVTVINPETGAVVSSVFVGPEPSKLALSLSGKYLFVVLDGANSVRVFDVAKQAATTTISLGAGITAADIAPVPGYPDSVAVQRQNRAYSPSENGTMIFDADGTSRKNVINGGHSIVYDPLSDRMYGFENQISSYGLRTMTADGNGVVELDYVEGVLIGNTRLTAAENGLLFSDSANVADPISRVKLGQYPGFGYGSVLAPDASTGKVYFAGGDRGGVKITAFDMYTFAPAGETFIPDTKDWSPVLIRWGDNGLAFTTANGKVWIVRSPLVGPKKSPVDLSVITAGLPEAMGANGTATATITVTNNGSAPATGVTVLDQLSSNVDVLDVKGSAGSATAANGVARFEVGELAPKAKATLTVQLKLKPTDTSQEHPLTVVTQSAFVRSRDPDPAPSNNHSVQTSKLTTSGPDAAAAGVDLTGSWKGLSQTSEGAGADLQATVEGVFEVKNVGTEAAAPTRLRFFLSGDRIYEPAFAQLIQESGVPELKPGAAYRVTLKARLRKGDDAIGLFIIAVVNATSSVAEASRKNNTVPGGPIP